MKTKPNDSAFSRPYSRDEHSGDIPENHWAFDGLTKREIFAAMAMQSVQEPKQFVGKVATEESYKDWAKKCIKMADTLINELNKD